MSIEIVAALLGGVSTIFSIVVITVNLRQRREQRQININESELPNKRKGLILLIGPSKGSSFVTIEYHLETLEYCWLVGSEKSIETATQLKESFSKVNFLNDYLVDIDDIASTYKAVSRILTNDIEKHGLEINEVIADITGGLKTMSAGMVLACAENGCNMQYMKTLRDQDGNPILNQPQIPIRVDLGIKLQISKAV